jgi:GH24 family phage-related lysozyme (muramidase)
MQLSGDLEIQPAQDCTAGVGFQQAASLEQAVALLQPLNSDLTALFLLRTLLATSEPVEGLTDDEVAEAVAGKLVDGTFLARAAGMIPLNPPAAAVTRQPIARLSTSDPGLGFLYRHEALRGVSEHLHFPGGSSGVSLGAGYDMKTRLPAAIENDLTSIGVSAAAAKAASAGAGLSGADARTFCANNRSLITLTTEQAEALLKKIVPQYENTVRAKIRADLLQNEFDALVSFAYNVGHIPTTMANLINAGDSAGAMNELKKVNTSNGVVVQGLVNRRNDEAGLYLNAKYQ